MRKYYKIFRIDIPSIEIQHSVTQIYETLYTNESCLVQDGGEIYESEEEAERVLNDYFENFPDRAKNEEYVIVKCYKMEEQRI